MDNNRGYDSMSEAVKALQRRGYTFDFDFKEEGENLYCSQNDTSYRVDELTISEFHRFEGMSSSDDASVVYAIDAKDGVKGLMVDAYGVYADVSKSQFLEKIRIKNN